MNQSDGGPNEPSNPRLSEFQAQVRGDISAGGLLPLKHYLDSFPGEETQIAEAWLGLAEQHALRDDAAEPLNVRPGGSLSDSGILDPERFGAYRLLSPLGQGGQGAVWLARDERLGRKVALKLLAPGTAAINENLLTRFRREAEVASSLDHPGICGVYEVGEAQGIRFIAMQYVAGESLAQKISAARARPDGSGGFSWSTVLDLGDGSGVGNGAATRWQPPEISPYTQKEISEPSRTIPSPLQHPQSDTGETFVEDLTTKAFQAAHRKTTAESLAANNLRLTGAALEDIAIIVRLILDVARAVQVAHDQGITHRDLKPANIMVTSDGRPIVLDFGLARLDQDPAGTLTASGELFGTLPYMAPEQLRARSTGHDPRTDVYALGVTLYECLALRRPFEAPTQEALFAQILSSEPHSLRTRNPQISKDLEVVCNTALEKDLDRRYATAQAFADDLERVLDQVPIAARPAGRTLRVLRWAQRNRALAASLLTICVLVLVSLIGLGWLLTKAIRAEKEAKQQFKASTELSERFFYDVYDAVSDLPGATRARQIMTDASLEYLAGMEGQVNRGDPTHIRLADVYLRVGDVQGGPALANLGDSAAALESYQRALAIFREAVKQHPDDIALKRREIQVRILITDLLGGIGRLDEANIQRAALLTEARALLAEHPEEPSLRRLLTGALFSEAENLLLQRKAIEAKRLAEEALGLTEVVQFEDLYSQQARGHSLLGIIAGQLYDESTCLKSLRKAVELHRLRIERDPKSVSVRHSLGHALIDLSRQREATPDVEAALASAVEAFALFRELMTADEDDARARKGFVTAGVQRAQLLLAVGRSTEAREVIRTVEQCARDVKQADKLNVRALSAWAVSRSTLGSLLFANGREAEGIGHLKAARQSLATSPYREIYSIRHSLVNVCLRLGNAQVDCGRLPEAEQSFRSAVRVCESLLELHADDFSLVNELASALDALGQSLHAQDKNDEGIKVIKRGLELRKQLLAKRPNIIVHQRNVSVSYFNLGRSLVAIGELDVALPYLEQAAAVDRGLASSDPANVELGANLALTLYKLGRTYCEDDQRDRGIPLLVEAAELSRLLRKQDNEDRYLKRTSVPILQSLSVQYARGGDFEQSLELSEELIELFESLSDTPDGYFLVHYDYELCLKRMAIIGRRMRDRALMAQAEFALSRLAARSPEAEAAERRDYLAIATARLRAADSTARTKHGERVVEALKLVRAQARLSGEDWAVVAHAEYARDYKEAARQSAARALEELPASSPQREKLQLLLKR